MRNLVRGFLAVVVGGVIVGCQSVPPGTYRIEDPRGTQYAVSVAVDGGVVPTPVPTALDPTPTPETLPSPDPSCVVRTADFPIVERPAPTRIGDRRTSTSPIEPNSLVKISRVVESEGYLWGETAFGWFALRPLGGDWWVTVDVGAGCHAVPGWPLGEIPPLAMVGIGWTARYGYDRAIHDAAGTLRAANYQPSITLTDNALDACTFAGLDWVVIARPWYQSGLGDDPNLALPAADSARARITDLAAAVSLMCPHNPRVMIQLTNETTFPSAEYLAAWIVSAVDACETRGWSCIPTMFSVGTPPESWARALRPAWDRMVETGTPLGMNIYGFARDAPLCDPTARHTILRGQLLRELAGSPFPDIVVSEAGRGAGDVPPDIKDALCFLDLTDGLYRIVCFWYVGGESAWSRARWFRGDILALAEGVRYG